MRTNKKATLVVSISLIFIAIITNSCKIGLGESVDAAAPKVGINYPPEGAIIRDTFVLAGSCSDDKGLASVKVSITKIDTQEKLSPYLAKIDEKKETWSIELNQAGEKDVWGRTSWDFSDGKYSIDVIAYDKVGRSSGVSSRSFVIDNTPPVFIIRSPGSISKKTPYGSMFKVNGTIADDQNIKSMDVSVYYNNIKIDTYGSENVETAGGTEVTIAKYGTDSASLLNKAYDEIYETSQTGEGTREFSCTIELTDAARQYTNSKNDSLIGNTTSCCYLYDDVYSELMGKNSQYGLEASGIKKIINGTYAGEENTISEVLDLLKENKIDTRENKLMFSLNPDASPTYSVTGFSFTGVPSNNVASAEQKITVVATAGRDEVYVKPETLKVYLCGPYEENDINSNEKLDAIYEAPEGDTKKLIARNDSEGDNYEGASVLSYNYAVTLPKSIVANKMYVVSVVGQDVDNIDFSGTAYYGFVGTVTGKPPSITIESPPSPEDLDVVGAGEKKYKGTVHTDTESIAEFKYEVVITDEISDDILEPITGSLIPQKSENSPTDYDWSFEIDATPGEGKQYLYTVSMTVIDNTGNVAEKIQRFHLDTTAPVVSINSIIPTVKGAGEVRYVNGTITVSGTIQDSNLASVTLSVSDGETTNEIPLGEVYSFEQEIDTTAFTNSTTLAITLKATDKAGNSKSVSEEVFIDQSTDKPIITLSNADKIVDELNQTSGNIFGTTSNNTLHGTITDDDGIAEVTIGYREKGGTSSYTTETVLTGGTSTTYPFQYTLPEDEGEYEIQISVTDTVLSAGEGSETYNKTVETIVLAVDAGAPVFANITPPNNGFYSSTIAVSGSITDGSGVIHLVAQGSGGSANYAMSKENNTNELILTDVITVPESSNTYTITYTATDKYGQKSTYAISYVVDSEAPVLTVSDIPNPYLKKEDKYMFSGTITDNIGGSGTAGVRYSLASLNGEATKSSENDWYVYVDLGTLSGEQTITFTGKDIAGNTASAVEKTIYVDTAAPASTIETTGSVYDSAGNEITTIEFGKTYLAGAAFTLQGVITETYFDKATLRVSKDGGSAVPVSFTTGGAASGAWSYTQNTGEDGLYNYTLEITDKAGRVFVDTISVRLDTTAPVLEINNPAAGESTIASTYTLKGTVDDTGCGVKEVRYKITRDAEVVSSGNAVVSGGSWRADAVSLGSIEGTLELEVTTKDKLENAPEAKQVTFYYDKAAPTLTETGVGVSGKTTNASFTFSGTASDTNELESVTITYEGSETTWIPTVSGESLWSQEILVGTAEHQVADGTHVFTIIAKDLAAKTTTLTRTVMVDTVEPTFAEPVFAVADATVATINYYKSAQVSVSINISDTGVGVSSVSYSVDNKNTWISLTKGSGNLWQGNIACHEGENAVWFKALDAAGNESISNSYTIATDTRSPECSLTRVDGEPLTGIKLVNKTKNVSVQGSASDSGSGLESVAIKVGSNDFTTPDVTVTSFTAGVWDATIPAASLQNGTVWARVTDKVGNTYDVNLFTLQVDASPPTVTINPIKDADPEAAGIQVNGLLTIRGTANDDEKLESIVAEYKNSSNNWVPLGTVVGTYNWSLSDLDTTAFTDKQDLNIRIRAADAAENESEALKTIIIDQDTDRPIIKLSNISLSGMTSDPDEHAWLKQTNTLYGTVSDDDGINSLEIQYAFKGASGETGSKLINVSGGSWNYILPSGDGPYELTFIVQDTAGTTFTSSTTDSTPQIPTPKLIDNDEVANSFGYIGSIIKDTHVYVNVDTKAPEVHLQGIKVDGSSVWETAYSSLKLGGITEKFDLKAAAQDANGIAAVSATIKGLAGIDTATYTGVAKTATGDTALEGDEIAYYLFSNILCNAGTGFMDITVTAEDNAGLTTNASTTVSVDNTAPEITILNPSSLIGGAETIRGTVDSIADLYYAVSVNEISQPEETAIIDVSTAWEEITDASLSWSVYFDSIDTTTQTHTNLFKYYLSILGITTDEALENGDFDTVSYLHVWIKAVDESGNVSYASKKVTIDPQGDRPIVSLTYPSEDNVTLGGTIRLFGTATDNIAAEYVWVQIDTNGDNVFDEADQAYLQSKGYTLGSMTDNTTTLSSTPSDNGIMVTPTGASWNLAINENGEFNPEEEKTKTLRLWVYATDEDNNLSLPVERTIIIDKDTPIIEQDSLKLVQYETFAGSTVPCVDGTVTSGTVVAAQDYNQDMSIKGVWFLTGNIVDESGIAKIVKNEITVVNTDPLDTVSSPEFTEYTGSGVSGYTMNIPIGNAASGSVGKDEISLVATEDTTTKLSISATYSVKYDNKVPEIITTGDDFKMSENVQNSNGFYTFGSVAIEAAVGGTNQTGVARVAVYFARDLSDPATEALYDVMISNGESDNTINSYKTTLVEADGLYWKEVPVVVSGTALTLSASDANIRTGGLARVNGVIYRIENIDGTTITLSGAPGDANTALFAIAQVIDNIIAESPHGEKNAAGYYKAPLNDDGDLMLESLTKQGTSYYWEASINSANIPDGPIRIHYVVYDKAGNYATHYVDGFVSNNQPRIAGIKLGTDENGNGSIDAGEFITSMSEIYASGLDSAGRKVSNATFPNQDSGLNSALKIKGPTVIQPEIVGGNGTIGYTYSVAKNTGGTTWADPYYSSDIIVPIAEGSTSHNIIDLTNNIEITLKNVLSNNIIDEANQKFSFTLWDSTTGTTAGIDSLSATLNVIMDVAIRDTISPKNVVKPFYWKNASDSSLFNNRKANGHIELPADLPALFNNTSGLFDKDPKVSGHITIEGIAHDNNLLSALSARIQDFNGGNSFEIATYASGAWTPKSLLTGGAIPSNGWACEVTQVTYGQANAAGLGITIPDGRTENDLVPYVSQATGHTVLWKLHFNTAKIANVAALDRTIQVTAKDKGEPSLSGEVINYAPNSSIAKTGQTGGELGAGEYTSEYRVDVVPYITSIHTPKRTNSGLKDNNIRSASGKYSIMKGTTNDFITVRGFNLNPGIADSRLMSSSQSALITSTAATGAQVVRTTAPNVTNTSFSLSNNLNNSGYLEVFTNGVRALNNVNSNDAKGSYAGAEAECSYNMEPDRNPLYNLNLSDDRYLRLCVASDTGIKNGYYPTMLMNGNNPVFAYIDSSATYDRQFQRQEFNLNGVSQSHSYLARGLSWDQMAMARDEAGRYIMMSSHNYANGQLAYIYHEYASCYMSGYDGGGYLGAAEPYWSNYFDNLYSSANNNALALDSVDHQTRLIDRYKNPKLVVKGNSTTTSNAQVYSVYYDDNPGVIYYRGFQIGRNPQSVQNNLYTNWSGGINYNLTKTNLTETGRYEGNNATVDSSRKAVTATGTEHFDFGVTSSNRVVVVYFDESKSTLMLTYSTAAQTGANPTTAVAFSTPIEVGPSYVGRDISLAIDNFDRIHIAAYDTSNGDLIYVFVPSYAEASSYVAVPVDSAFSVGSLTQIKIRNNIPYIAYYNSTESGTRDSIKLAYCNSAITSVETVVAGTNDNFYVTGNWEVLTVPAKTPPQGGNSKFKQVNLGFDNSGNAILGYLGANIEFVRLITE